MLKTCRHCPTIPCEKANEEIADAPEARHDFTNMCSNTHAAEEHRTADTTTGRTNSLSTATDLSLKVMEDEEIV